ncbi:hypothetical protein [Mesorhizobium sp. BR1-1-4]|uniref:hypothetical protein n=1 Tax=Mesorhizobium sp. BR1-1-4 TaxID=2876650 RepID=UPI001CCF7F7D|nr:hypothetical protein [Mesorhizobium sp. BR1-1-4]MBZ9926774.1 hypothetical protein [Mesorhizobium sp. BR1-1-4]
MLEREDFLQDKKSLSATISDLCRYIAFGLLVAFYTISADNSSFSTHLKTYGVLVFLIGFCGAMAILCDYLQYVFGLITVEKALATKVYEYDDASGAYWGRQAAFEAKQVFVGVGAISMVLMVLVATFLTR